MLDNSFSLSTQKMRKKTREVDRVQKEFTENQKALIANGVTPPEAIQMTAENKIQRVVEQCRKSHGGPISEEKEIEGILERIEDEKRLKSALTAEIRYRNFTLLKIKESNPIFKQRNLSACHKSQADSSKVLCGSSMLCLPEGFRKSCWRS